MRRRWIMGLLLLAGCYSSGFRVQLGRQAAPPPNPQYAQGPSQPSPGPSSAPAIRASGPSGNVLAQLDQLMRASGWLPMGPVVGNQLQQNGIVAYSISAVPGQCYGVFGIAENERTDLNLWVTDNNQRITGSDMRSDPHPWSIFCPPYGGNHVVRLNMRNGAGPFSFVVYSGPRGRVPDIATFYSGNQTASVVATLDAQAQGRLSAQDQRLSGEGYRRVGEPLGSTFNDPGERDVPLHLQQGYCYVFAAMSNATVSDADLLLVDGNGSRLAEDRGAAADAFVEHCPAETEQAQIRIRVARGRGDVFLTAYTRQNPQSPAPQESANARTAPVTPITSTSTVESHALEERFALADSDMHARGYENYNDSNETSLEQNTPRETRIELEGGKCYAVIGVGDDDIVNLDLSIRDSRNRILDSDTEPNARPVVRVCPETTGRYTLNVIAPQGEGRIAVQAYRWPRGTRGPFGLRGLMYVRLAEMMGLLATEGYEPDLDYTPERGVLTANNEVGTHSITLQGGQCYVVLAVGGEQVTNLDLSLVQGSAVLGTDRSNNSLPMVYRCSTTNEEVIAQTRAAVGAGDYFVQLYKRTRTQ